jgi:NitT/TauT family transport system permease protein
MNRRKYIGLIVPMILLAVWYFANLLNLVPSYLLPSPFGILKIGWDFIAGNMDLTPYSGTFYIHFTASISRVLAGFLIASILGILLGYASGRSDKFNGLVNPFINGLRAVPGIGWLPVALVWFGVGQKTAVFLIALAAFFPVYINVCAGAAKVPEIYIKSAKMMGASKSRIFYTVILPASLDSLITGLRLALGVSWAYLVLGEITGVSQGLGAVMMDARMLGHIDVVVMSMVIIAILGWISDYILVGIFKFLSKLRGRHYGI